MQKRYEVYEKPNITQEVINSIQIGDLIKVNDWGRPMRVRAVGNTHFIMTTSFFGKPYYSICEKFIRGGQHNTVYRPKCGYYNDEFVCGPSNQIFSSYEYSNEEDINLALKALENEEMEVSTRYGLGIHKLQIKRFIK